MLGALIMFFFVLGTSPVFGIVGVAAAKLSETFKDNFMKIAAAILIFLGLSSLNGVLIVLDSPITFGSITRPISYFFSEERFASSASSDVAVINGKQQVFINVLSNGYSPNYVRVKVGVPVELTLQTKDTYSCASFFLFKEFNINLQLSANDTQSVVFTPTKKGSFPFSCSMGMYSGIMEVI